MADSLNIDYKFKLMIIGESTIGKTSFISRYTSNTFKLEYLSTVGIDFQIKNLKLKGKSIRLQIWDTAGQERYRNITKNYFQASNGFVIAYDITNMRSFECVANWIKEIDESASPDSKKVLIGMKCDKDGREISKEDGERLAAKYGMKFFETSAKDNINVNETFEYLTNEILELEESGTVEPRNSIIINKGDHQNANKDKEKKKGCCK